MFRHYLQVGPEGAAQLTATFKGHTDCVEALAVSPSGQLLASAGWDGQLLIWRAGQQVGGAEGWAGQKDGSV